MRRTNLALIAILLFAIAARLLVAVRDPPIHDEYQWMRIADSIRLTGPDRHLPAHGDQHPAGQAYWGAFGAFFLGRTLLGYRIAAVILGTLGVYLAFRLGKAIGGPRAGLFAASLLALNEYHVDVSALCTEKTYLAFAALALLLARTVLRRTTPACWIAFGAACGAATMTKESFALWAVPLFVVLAWSHRRERARLFPAVALGAATFFAFILPDVLWNLFGARDLSNPSSQGAGYQLGRLAVGGFSWGPLALYIRPLFYQRIEGTLSEVASMTTGPGLVLLASAAASFVLLRSAFARLLGILGFATLVFFSFFATPECEFWWSDLSVVAFVPLAGAVLAKATRPVGRVIAAVALAVVALGFASQTSARANVYPLEWGAPPPRFMETFRTGLSTLFLLHRDRDHVALYRQGPYALPVLRDYEHALGAYAEALEVDADPARLRWRGFPIDPQGFDADAELAWARAELARLGDP